MKKHIAACLALLAVTTSSIANAPVGYQFVIERNVKGTFVPLFNGSITTVEGKRGEYSIMSSSVEMREMVFSRERVEHKGIVVMNGAEVAILPVGEKNVVVRLKVVEKGTITATGTYEIDLAEGEKAELPVPGNLRMQIQRKGEQPV